MLHSEFMWLSCMNLWLLAGLFSCCSTTDQACISDARVEPRLDIRADEWRAVTRIRGFFCSSVLWLLCPLGVGRRHVCSLLACVCGCYRSVEGLLIKKQEKLQNIYKYTVYSLLLFNLSFFLPPSIPYFVLGEGPLHFGSNHIRMPKASIHASAPHQVDTKAT